MRICMNVRLIATCRCAHDIKVTLKLHEHENYDLYAMTYDLVQVSQRRVEQHDTHTHTKHNNIFR